VVGVDPITFVQKFIQTRDNSNQLNDAKFLGYAFLVSTNFLEDASVAYYYKDTYGLPANSPPFKQMLITAPINAVFPLSFLGVKTYSDVGYWFRVDILNSNPNSIGLYSAAMSPIAFIYLAFGFIGTIVFFILYGILMNFVDSLIMGGYYEKILFLSLLMPVILLESGVHGTISNIIRILVYYPIVYRIFSKKSS
jgi:uncharacterized protein with PQ loop repeat